MSEIPPQFTEYPRADMRPRIRFEAIGEAWRFMTANLGIWVLASFLTVVLTLLLFLPFYVMGIVKMIGMDQQRPDIGQIMSFYGLIFLSSILSGVGQSIGLAGMYNMALKQIQGYEISIKDYFPSGGVILSHVGAGLLIALGTMVGSFFCYLPGLLFAGLTMLTHPIIAHRRLGAIEAMKTSWNLMKNDMWMALAFFFVVSLAAGLGMFACGIGILFSFPLLPLGIALVYRDYTVADPAASAGPYAPYNIMDR